MKKTIHIPLLVLAICLLPRTPLRAEGIPDAQQLELGALAKKIKIFLDKKRIVKVHVGPFQGPGIVKGGAGAGVQLALATALKKLGFTIDEEKYEVEIKGTYAALPTDAHGLGVVVAAELFDVFGRSLGQTEGAATPVKFEREIFGQEAVPQLLGLSSSNKPTADYQNRSKEWIERYLKPSAHIDGATIQARPCPPPP